jgi:hypothetical protein
VNIHTGMSMREAVDAARRLGAEVFVLNRTGEYRFAFPGMPHQRANCRRKDAPAPIVVWLKRLRERVTP